MNDFINIRSSKGFFFLLVSERVIHFLGLKNPNPIIRTVPHGPLLAPIVFRIAINDLNAGTVCALSKFADDSKLGGVLQTPDGCAIIWRNLKRMGKGTEKNAWSSAKGKAKSFTWGGISHVLVQVDCKVAWKKPDKERPFSPGGQHIDHEPVVCFCGNESQ